MVELYLAATFLILGVSVGSVIYAKKMEPQMWRFQLGWVSVINVLWILCVIFRLSGV